MFKNYLITAWRNIVRDKLYTLINIGGLAIGMTTAIFIILYVVDEVTYDTVHEKHERIYRLESHFVINNKDDYFAVTQLPMAPTLKDEFPEIEEYVRLAPAGTMFLKLGEREFEEDSIMIADSTIFKVFTHNFIAGDPEKALLRPYTMVMTESMAKKYFGDEYAIGKTLTTIDGRLLEVTGVIEDMPGNVHLRYKGLLSIATAIEDAGAERFNDRSAGSFWNVGLYSYILLKDGAEITSILDKFPDFYDKYMKSLGDQIHGSYYLKAKPLTRVHHYSSDLGYDQEGGNIKYVNIFALIAILILLIAGINYMNLSTARSARRSRESGIRKIVGAKRGILIKQFLTESLVLTLISFIFSLILIKLFLPYFNQLADKSLSFSVFKTPALAGGLILLAIITGLLSGSYPAFYLSSFEPVKVIKGQTELHGGNGILRKILVVFQFAVSVAMITGTFIITSQFNYMRNSNPGFNHKDLVILQLNDTTLRRSAQSIKQELLNNPDISGVAFSNGNPGAEVGIQVMRVEGENGSMEDLAINLYFIDYDYIDLMGIELLEGRNYNRSISTDPQKAFIVNETAAKRFGWVNEASAAIGDYSAAIGKRFQFNINLDGTAQRDGEIVGIVRDFHYASMHNIIEPVVLLLADNDLLLANANIRINGNNTQSALDYIDKVRVSYNDPYPLKYEFMEERLGKYYRDEERISLLSRTFTLLTIFIAAIGLLGLSSFLTQARTREIGVRKVMGASANNIAYMFIREFSVWVVIANLIAAPFAFLLMNKWLQAFAYKTPIHASIFIAALAISLALALVTVSFRVFKAASLNPSEAIRTP